MKKIAMLLLTVVVTVTFVFGESHPVKAETDYLSMSWEQIVEEAKKEGSLTFFAWWGEEYWKTGNRGAYSLQ